MNFLNHLHSQFEKTLAQFYWQKNKQLYNSKHVHHVSDIGWIIPPNPVTFVYSNINKRICSEFTRSEYGKRMSNVFRFQWWGRKEIHMH